LYTAAAAAPTAAPPTIEAERRRIIWSKRELW
jgi:hypothetical protein